MGKTKINTIFTINMDNGTEAELGIDDERNLYWNKKAVVTKQKVKLRWWVNCGIIVASFSTLAIAIVTLLHYFHISW